MNLKDELGFALEKRGDEWLVVEDGADDRLATLNEQVLWEALTAPGGQPAPVAPALALSDEQIDAAIKAWFREADGVAAGRAVRVPSFEARMRAAFQAAAAEPLRRNDGTLSGVFVAESAPTTDSATTQAQLRDWIPFVPYHARRVLERAAVLLDAAMAVS